MAVDLQTFNLLPDIRPFETAPGAVVDQTILPRAEVALRYDDATAAVSNGDSLGFWFIGALPKGYAYLAVEMQIGIHGTDADLDNVYRNGWWQITSPTRAGGYILGQLEALTADGEMTTYYTPPSTLNYAREWGPPRLPRGFLYNLVDNEISVQMKLASAAIAAGLAIQTVRSRAKFLQYDLQQVLQSGINAAPFRQTF